jgi:hypothetical protein
MNRGLSIARRALLAAALGLTLGACAAHGTSYPPVTRPGPGLVQLEVYDRSSGTTLPAYPKDGRRYIVGTPGHEYALRIRNTTGARILVVTSVDGVNVISGDAASPSQSGYVLDPWGSVEIIGWRKSLERTAAFFFTEHQNSYASRTGRPNNVGVIGVAAFREKSRPIARRERPQIAAEAETAAPAPPPVVSGQACTPARHRPWPGRGLAGHPRPVRARDRRPGPNPYPPLRPAREPGRHGRPAGAPLQPPGARPLPGRDPVHARPAALVAVQEKRLQAVSAVAAQRSRALPFHDAQRGASGSTRRHSLSMSGRRR